MVPLASSSDCTANLVIARSSPLRLREIKFLAKHLFPRLLLFGCQNRKDLVIGFFATFARFSKLQAVSMTQSPFDRRHRMASVRVDTAGAGEASHRVDIPYLDVETATRLFGQLGTAAARTAFRW